MGRWVHGLVLAVLLAGTAGCAQPQAATAPGVSAINQPIGVLTALPLFMAEGGLQRAFAGPEPSPLLTVAARHGQPVPLETLDATDLTPLHRLVLAQPRRLGAGELVALDAWVRNGGRVLVFADPMLVWRSDHPLGDSRRPPPVSLLDPLFDHWGILLSDADLVAQDPATLRWQGVTIRTRRPGAWTARTRACRAEGLIATCQIGKGRAILVADADLLDGREKGGSDSEAHALVEALFVQLRGAGRKGKPK